MWLYGVVDRSVVGVVEFVGSGVAVGEAQSAKNLPGSAQDAIGRRAHDIGIATRPPFSQQSDEDSTLSSDVV